MPYEPQYTQGDTMPYSYDDKSGGKGRVDPSERPLLESNKEEYDYARLIASGAPEWVIQKRMAENDKRERQGLAEEGRLQGHASDKEYPTNHTNFDGSKNLYYFENVRMKDRRETQAWEQEEAWVKQGKTRREIIELKRDMRLNGPKREEQARQEHLRNMEAMRAARPSVLRHINKSSAFTTSHQQIQYELVRHLSRHHIQSYQPSMSGWFSRHGRGTPGNNSPEGSRYFRNSETDLREQREEEQERERLQASGVPEWVIERKLADNKRDLEQLEIQLDREEREAIANRLQRYDLDSIKREEWRSAEECKLWARDVRWAKAGITRRQIVQLKREQLLGLGQEQVEEVCRAQAARSQETRDAMTGRRMGWENQGLLEEGDDLPPYS
ncbi:MAG: hypothetical protein Q9218_007076 [Villophora microphyllina]